jgi:DNA-binding NarL/FixJ family response regulator
MPFSTFVPQQGTDSSLVSIVEGQPLFRAALAGVIDGLPGVRPGPIAGSVEEFLAYRAPAGGVVLLDLHLPGIRGAAATLAIVEAGHRPLIVSAQTDQADVLAALAAGARGYLSKSADATEVAAAVRHVANGGTYVAHGLAGLVLNGERTRPAGQRLTPREQQVLALLAEGERDVDIARALTISVRTVRSHLDRIREKTGQRRRSGLTRLAISEGLLRRGLGART